MLKAIHLAVAWLLAGAPLFASAQGLTVSAAASLSDAFRAIGSRFEAQRPGVRVRFNFAASGVLLQQIRQGAPVDVLATADEETVQAGIDAGLLDTRSRRVFATNEMVLVAPLGSDSPNRLSDLATSTAGRVALGKPATVPAGRYARAGLEQAGMWDGLQGRLILADNVRQVLDYVARGEVAAGFVYRSEATPAERADARVRLVQVLPLPTPIRYPAARVTDSRMAALADAFIAYLRSPEVQALLARHGFLPAP